MKEQTMEGAVLLPCPFCGSSDLFCEPYDFSSAYIVCNGCGARGSESLQESDDEEIPGEIAAEAAWNCRATPQPPPEAGSVGVPELQAMVLLLRTALVKAMNGNFLDNDAQPSATAKFCNAALSSVDAMLSAAPAPKESP